MFKYLKKLLNLKKLGTNGSPGQQEPPDRPLSYDLRTNLALVKESLGYSSDLIFRHFKIGSQEAALIFMEGLSDEKLIDEHVLKPLMGLKPQSPLNLETVKNSLVSVSQTSVVTKLNDLLENCLTGDSILLLDQHNLALVLNTKGYETRAIEEPQTEIVVRGPKEGFTEKLQTNISMLRRKLKNPNLVFENRVLGTQTATIVTIAYLRNIASPELVREVRYRLSKIKMNAILESGYIEQLIEDAPYSPFPTIGNSEKPDIVAANLLEGRVAILVDGTPVVLTVPKLFMESFQSPEDYYSRPYYASLVRLLRYMAFFISTMAPGLYVALVNYHQELIPTNLIISMASARKGTPFPAVLEALGMGAVYEILREAGIRLPRPVGSAISIVGALVIGEAAVTAGLVSAPLLIVVALTAIASFVVNSLYDVTVILRLFFTILAGFMGIFGIIAVFLGTLIHLCALKSFGTPYLSPIAPLRFQGLLDLFIRAPIKNLDTRSSNISLKKRP